MIDGITGKWFWCPKCKRIAPQLTRRQAFNIRNKMVDEQATETERFVKKIGFFLANPLLMTRIYFQSFMNCNKSLRCGPCRCDMDLAEVKDSKVRSAPNYEDLVKEGFIAG